jgi:mercuric ion transport protein
MNAPPPSKRPRDRVVPLAYVGTALVAVVCCAGPALVAGGVATGLLAGMGAWLTSSWLVVAAAVVTIAAVLVGLRHARRRHAPGPDSCCSPPHLAEGEVAARADAEQ